MDMNGCPKPLATANCHPAGGGRHCFTAPPQHVHSQLLVFSPNLFLINFSHKAQQNRGRAVLGLLGVDAGSNNVRELLAISIP
ncbi:uncharacterized [Tachysurus ichikawai]